MSLKNGNNHFTYTEPILAHQFLRCLWSVQSGVVISRLGDEVLIDIVVDGREAHN